MVVVTRPVRFLFHSNIARANFTAPRSEMPPVSVSFGTRHD
jgi:hypothetical protein